MKTENILLYGFIGLLLWIFMNLMCQRCQLSKEGFSVGAQSRAQVVRPCLDALETIHLKGKTLEEQEETIWLWAEPEEGEFRTQIEDCYLRSGVNCDTDELPCVTDVWNDPRFKAAAASDNDLAFDKEVDYWAIQLEEDLLSR